VRLVSIIGNDEGGVMVGFQGSILIVKGQSETKVVDKFNEKQSYVVHKLLQNYKTENISKAEI
jgi:hypothetical protein